MSAQATSSLALRPMLPDEAPVLAEIFRQSIMELTGDDYSQTQQEAWAAAADDIPAFKARLGRHITIVATADGSPVGFGSLEGKDKIDLLYVHPAVAGYGAGAMLADALEKLSKSRGAEALNVDASDAAAEFFANRGYEPQQRNQVQVGDQWLSNTTMRKTFPVG